MGFFSRFIENFIEGAVRYNITEKVEQKIDELETTSFNCGPYGAYFDEEYAKTHNGLTQNQEAAERLKANKQDIIDKLVNMTLNN